MTKINFWKNLKFWFMENHRKYEKFNCTRKEKLHLEVIGEVIPASWRNNVDEQKIVKLLQRGAGITSLGTCKWSYSYIMQE